MEPYSVAILVDFSALRAGFSTHIQWREGDTAQPNIHIQWSASPVDGPFGWMRSKPVIPNGKGATTVITE